MYIDQPQVIVLDWNQFMYHCGVSWMLQRGLKADA